MKYTEYVTKEADRWDLIAYEFYGNAKKYEAIIAANPDIPITPILESGLIIKIPEIDDSSENANIEDLPPWLI